MKIPNLYCVLIHDLRFVCKKTRQSGAGGCFSNIQLCRISLWQQLYKTHPKQTSENETIHRQPNQKRKNPVFLGEKTYLL
jgi:hypothetical protein